MPELLIESQAQEFIKKLPEIHGLPLPPAVHLLMIAIRSRYAREMMGFKVHDLVVERKIIKPHPRKLEGDTNANEVDPKGSGMSSNPNGWRNVYMEKLYNLAVLQHNGHYFINGVVVPQQAMAIYGTVAPRNVASASCELMKSMVDSFYQYPTNPGAQIKLTKTDSDFFGLLHKYRYPSKYKFHTVDIDNGSIYNDALDMLSPYNDAIWMKLSTSRGYHIIMDVNKIDADFYRGGGLWPRMLARWPEKDGKAQIEINHESQEPIPGSRYYKSGEDPKKPNYVTII